MLLAYQTNHSPCTVQQHRPTSRIKYQILLRYGEHLVKMFMFTIINYVHENIVKIEIPDETVVYVKTFQTKI